MKNDARSRMSIIAVLKTRFSASEKTLRP